METIDTTNKFAVGSNGDKIIILNPTALLKAISKEDAINLAATLVAIVGDKETFEKTYEAICNC